MSNIANSSQRKDYIWNTVGVLLQNATSPLLLIVVTRINGIYDSGLFSFAFSIAIIFWAISMWGGRTYQVSDRRIEFSHRSYIMVRLVLAVVVLIGACVFSIVNNYDSTKTSIIVALVLLKVIESVADALYGILQVNNRLYVVGKSLTYKFFIGLSVFTVVDVLTNNLLLSIFGLVFVNIFLIIFYDWRIATKLDNFTIKPSQIRKSIIDSIVIMKRCAPVFIVIFLSMFPLNIPRYFVDLYHEEQIGYFGIVAMPVTLIVLTVTFILQPNVVNLAKLYEDIKLHKFNLIVKKIITTTFFIGVIILLVVILLGVKILDYIFALDFNPYFMSLVVITIGSIANAIVAILTVILTIMRSLKSQFYILASTNLLLVPSSLLIVSKYGLLGGVALFLIVSVFQAGLLFFVYSRSLKKTKLLQS